MSFTEQQYASLNKVQLDESWKYNLAEFFIESTNGCATRFFVAGKTTE